MSGKKGRILLVDDEPQVRSFVKAFLQSARFEVVEANDGVEAVEIVESGGEPFDILVTDVKMPRMDGTTLAGVLT
jgi:CheY-like chemotaxis protein